MKTTSTQTSRPNILWITCEDTGPQLGCYGDAYAKTPNLDTLASRGIRYVHAWSTAPVCAPARTAILTGMYPSSIGAIHMRSLVPVPSTVEPYPRLMRAAGYYCTNNAKTDYNIVVEDGLWDESSKKAHYRNRPAGKPFLAVFNIEASHEGRIRQRRDRVNHDPAGAPVPPYQPDDPEVRLDWVGYYDAVTQVDTVAGRMLRDLAAEGLAEDTIVLFCGDHGPGMPRSKRYVCDSGLHVPLLVYIPPKYANLVSADSGTTGASERLVGFVDMAPTFLSIAGVQPPAAMQGHAFLGKYQTPPPAFMFGEKGRMDERYDLSRSVTDGQFVYVRNYTPQYPHGQHVNYMFLTPTTQVWHKLFEEGKLNKVQSAFWQPKPVEELYDLKKDPWETENLAGSNKHKGELERLRKALREHLVEVRDLGFLPEEEMHARSEGRTPCELARDEKAYPMERILETAELASQGDEKNLPALSAALSDKDAAVRYWGLMGLGILGTKVVRDQISGVRKCLEDPSRSVQIAAAELLAEDGAVPDRDRALKELMANASASGPSPYARMEALNAIDRVTSLPAEMRAQLEADLKTARDESKPKPKGLEGRIAGKAEILLEHIVGEGAPEP